jgi:methylase of polypeptide subunit release factors
VKRKTKNIDFLPLRPSRWQRAMRRAGKRLLALRYRRFSPDSEPDRVVKVGTLRLHVLRSVFNPSMHFTSGVLARYIMKHGVVPLGASVLDLGTGTGVLGIGAAMAGAGAVVSTDINPQAVKCAAVNVRLHGLESKISVMEGDLFEPVGRGKFDLVLCNPPYFRGEARSMAERSFYGGPALDWVRRFSSDLHGHLNPGGSAIISIGDAAEIGAVLRLLAGGGWSIEQIERREMIVETVYLFRLTEISKTSKKEAIPYA